MSALVRGDLLLLLHAHLPYVRHPENAYHLEENWLYEAITATYLPIVQELQKLGSLASSPRLTISLSPTLCSMLRDKLLIDRYRAYLDRLLRLGEDELTRAQGDAEQAALVRFYLSRFTELRSLFRSLDGDLVAAFGELQDRGVVELMTTCATHAYLPVVREQTARRAQLIIAVRHYRECFGRYPRGIWLPECGYVDGLDQLLAELDLRYFFLDAHGLTYARPRPPLGLHAPIFTRAGVAAFGRDLMSSKQVWSSTEGYPADGVYREFYRDIGFDRPLEQIAPYIHPDGIRVNTGYKYHRVTGPRVDLQDKAPYEPEAARAKAREHARDFVEKRQAQIAWLAQRMDRRPVIVSPYDAELFGHWWFEGPTFLGEVLRLCSQPDSAVNLQTASGYLLDHPINAVCDPAPSSWGEGGYSAVWLDQSNDWIYRHIHHAESKLHDLVTKFGGKDASDSPQQALIQRALTQAGRELLLAQSSDWAFIMKTGTAVSYAESRVKTHLQRFVRLASELESGTLDEAFVAECESRDNLFPNLDPKLF